MYNFNKVVSLFYNYASFTPFQDTPTITLLKCDATDVFPQKRRNKFFVKLDSQLTLITTYICPVITNKILE